MSYLEITSLLVNMVLMRRKVGILSQVRTREVEFDKSIPSNVNSMDRAIIIVIRGRNTSLFRACEACLELTTMANLEFAISFLYSARIPGLGLLPRPSSLLFNFYLFPQRSCLLCFFSNACLFGLLMALEKQIAVFSRHLPEPLGRGMIYPFSN